MSARRELRALWSRCLALRERAAQPAAAADTGTRRRLDACIDELASATRRLGNAGMLTPAQAGDLEGAMGDLVAARAARRPLAEAVARCADTLWAVAEGLRIPLPDTRPTPVGHAAHPPRELVGVPVDPLPAGAPTHSAESVPPVGAAPAPALADDPVASSASEAVHALAFVTSAAAKGGHLLGEFSRARTSDGYQLSARCRGCGEEVRLGRGPDEWWFAPITPCSRASADAAVPTGIGQPAS
jgi:hypothetical protein